VAWNNNGIDLGMLGKYDEALKAFDRATTINSSYAEAWNNRALPMTSWATKIQLSKITSESLKSTHRIKKP
jgi:tetratricopeptide (TPR) repeat protein